MSNQRMVVLSLHSSWRIPKTHIVVVRGIGVPRTEAVAWPSWENLEVPCRVLYMHAHCRSVTHSIMTCVSKQVLAYQYNKLYTDDAFFEIPTAPANPTNVKPVLGPCNTLYYKMPNFSHDTVPLLWQCHEIFGHFFMNGTHLAPD